MGLHRRFTALIGMTALLAVGTGTANAHHDDGKGGVSPPGMEAQAHEFDNVAGAPAAEGSNAPRGHAPCIQGMAADTYACDRVDMLSHLTRDDLGLSFVNDMWGWTDPATGADYALVGGTEGTVVVDISDPARPLILGTLPSASTVGGRFWRDIKVHADHMYVVSEHRGHGMQVYDLTELRTLAGPPVELTETAHYAGFGGAHNLHINEDTGFAYVVGSNTCAGGLHMVDLADPASPVSAGCYSDHGYIHDTQCVVYEGPDAEHHGKEICFSSAATFNSFSPAGIVNTLSIVDVTDKSAPVALSRHEYPRDGYSHQGWLTPDQGYFVHNDELDEIFYGDNTSSRIFDVTDLDAVGDPVIVVHDTTSIGHNMYIDDGHVFASNYTAGLRIFDASGLADGEMPEVAYFDLYPENDHATFEGGTWSNYPFFRQKHVVGVSSMDRGLFILKPRLNRAGGR